MISTKQELLNMTGAKVRAAEFGYVIKYLELEINEILIFLYLNTW